MINKKESGRKLSVEILLTVALCFALALILYLFMAYFTPRVIEEYCFFYAIELDEYDLYRLDVTMFGVAFGVSATFFTVLFLTLFGQKLSYIRTLISGIRELQSGAFGKQVELVGNNELTQLGEAINYLSESQSVIREKEKRLILEREELIRTLSHDIRTPLTSLMAYTELLTSKSDTSEAEWREYLSLVDKKSKQIKELTDILLDGGQRKTEYFDDARLLFVQLAEELTEALEEDFTVSVALPSQVSFSGSFDVGELRRICDNLISNIKKYAEPSEEVTLSITLADSGIVIRQSNGIKKSAEHKESYRMGLNSIRRIAQNYGGGITVSEETDRFEITVTLSDI